MISDNPHRFEQSELPAALQRYKRNENSNQKQQYTIEIIVGYDDTFQRFHRHLDRDRLNEYILLLMKMASNILADKSIGNYPIGIHVIDIIATNNLNAERVVGSDIEMGLYRNRLKSPVEGFQCNIFHITEIRC